MKFFDNPIISTYRFPAADLTGGAGVYGYIQGPSGARGQIQYIQTAVTTAVTVAAADVLIGTDSDTDAYATHEVAISAIDTVAVTSPHSLSVQIPADQAVRVGTDGAATLGEADIAVCIAWERRGK